MKSCTLVLMADKEPFEDVLRKLAEDESVSPDEFGKKIQNIEALEKIKDYQEKIKVFREAIETCERRIDEILKSLKRKG